MSQSEQRPSASDGPQSALERRETDSESGVDSESRPSVSIRCPSCGERVDATLALSDDGPTDTRTASEPGEYRRTERADDSLVAADGGTDPEYGRPEPTSDPVLEGELCGKPVQCTACDDEFELLFYY